MGGGLDALGPRRHNGGMQEGARPQGRFGWIIVAVAIVGSAVGVGIWSSTANRSAPPIDVTGFDLSATPTAQLPTPTEPGPSSAAPAPSSLTMMKPEAGIHFGETSAPNVAASNPATAKKESSRVDFKQNARKHENDVRSFAQRMTAKYPVIQQYGRDWMKYPDLKKLNDDYMRNHDPVAFIVGLSRAPNLGTMVKNYAGKPEIREFVVQGLKQAPGELTASAMGILQSDSGVKNLITNIVSGMGLPPSITGMINSAGSSPQPVDQNKVMKDVLGSPDMQKALQGR